MSDEKAKHFSIVIIIIAVIAFGYITIQAMVIVQKRQISTSDGIYSNRVTLSPDIKEKAQQLTKNCTNQLCQTQKLLDYVTSIPYYTEHFQAHSPKRTMELREGDCDDKSNLLISLLHALKIEAYFVLVPKHIFVIASLDDKRLANTKALWLNNKPYYILESTAKNSAVGFPLKYKIKDIEMILDPFKNREVDKRNIQLFGTDALSSANVWRE